MIVPVKLVVGNLRSSFESDFPVDIVDAATSCFSSGYQYSHAYRRRVAGGKRAWDGKIHLLNVLGRTLPTGAVPMAVKALQAAGYEVRIRFQEEAKLLPIVGDVTLPLGGLTPRDYQIAAVNAVLNGSPIIGQKGVVRVPTAGGKTLIAAMILNALQVPGIVLVHGQNLVDQTVKELRRLLGKRTVGILMAEDFEPGQYLVASVDTIASRLKRKDPEIGALLRGKQVLIADEAHRVGGGTSTFQKVMDACPASVRVGMSGTPFKKTVDVDMLLMSRTGSLLYDVLPSALQALGHLSQADLIVYDVGGVPEPELSWREAMNKLVFRRTNRSRFIAETCLDLALKGRKILLIAGNSVEFTHNLEIAWKAAVVARNEKADTIVVPGARFVTGTSGREAVNDAVDALRDGRISLLCNTVLFDEGTNVPDLDVVVLACPGKSFVRVMQRIGRGLRPKIGRLLVIDFFDSGNQYLVRHFFSRLGTYESEDLFEDISFKEVTLATEEKVEETEDSEEIEEYELA